MYRASLAYTEQCALHEWLQIYWRVCPHQTGEISGTLWQRIIQISASEREQCAVSK